VQRGKAPSYYAIYFNLLPPGAQPDEVPRVGFVGDGTERIKETPDSTHGLLLGRVDAADWNGDGDTDLLTLASYGYLWWYERSFLEHGYAPATVEQVETR